MKKWKVRQELYHRLNKNHPDEYGPDDIQLMEDTSDEAVFAMVCRYIEGYVPEKVIYPAKSYFVAMVYARLLMDHFGENPIAALCDSQLLYGNDPYFLEYGRDPQIYDALIKKFGWDFDLTLGEIPDVESYFRAEFMLDQDF